MAEREQRAVHLQVAGAPQPDVGKGIARLSQDAFAKRSPEIAVAYRFPAKPEHGEVCRQQAVEHQIVERGNQPAAGQIAGSAEDDERAGLDRREGLLSGGDINPLRGRHRVVTV